MNLSDADCVTAGWILLVAKTEAVLITSFALSSREADGTVTALGVSREPSTKIDGSLLEHLGGDLRSPGESGNQFGRGSVWSDHEHAAGALAALPAVERVDQVEA
jgi:hypothetical protein